MHSPTRVTYSNIASVDAVITCARDLRAILERRVGTLDACNVHVDGVVYTDSLEESFRVKLHVTAGPFEIQLTMVPHADVYMALTQTFDQVAWLLPRLHESSSTNLLRKLRAIAIDALRSDSRRFRPNGSALPGDEVRLS
ncbi:MAG TPA: hypothetical protein VJS42_05925 [Steroidobacteraceae bacterium]|nr:hypothetical protein [Steroidobacteraceae bacterium]